jgi:hypothetical protein
MKRLLTAIALALALSVSALAGDIPISGSPAPIHNGTTQSTSPGDIPTDGSAGELTDAALSALLMVFGCCLYR